MKNTKAEKHNEPNFTPIDLQEWERGQIFYYFTKMAPTGYSLTVKLDVTRMKDTLERAGKKFYPAYLWLITKTLNNHKEFRMAEKDGCLGYYNSLTPLYATFHEDDKTFSLMWTKYDDDFSAFYDAYIKDQKCYGENHGILAKQDMLPPPNAYTVSCVPWICFDHFSVHSYENKPYYFPSIEAGKFVTKDGKVLMPLSITCHHATTDGYHVRMFLEELQTEADRFEIYTK